MKNRLSSFVKAVSSGESCGICAVIVTVLCAVVLYQMIGLIIGHVQEHFATQNFTAFIPQR
jgi:hypothetical protein